MFKRFISSLVIVTSVLSTVGVVSAGTFNDISNHWAESFIEGLSSGGIVNGMEQGVFGPDLPITRAELTKIAYSAFVDSEAPDFTKEVATIKTNMGDIKLYFYPELAPKTTENFQQLAEMDSYDDVPFHRVIDEFMIQGGDFENLNGTGGYSFMGPDTIVIDEFDTGLDHVYGAVSMANAGPGTTGSQFFIVQAEDGTEWLNGRHSVFGQVHEGMDVVDAIAAVETDGGDGPVDEVLITDVIIGEELFLDAYFTDVEIEDWYAPYLEVARMEGIVSGFENGEFRPNQAVNRVEALKIIIEAAGVDMKGYDLVTYGDTNPAAWYTEYINYAAKNDIVSGYEGGLFKPELSITRAEVAKIVSLLQSEIETPVVYDENLEEVELEFLGLNGDFATDGEYVYFFSELGFTSVISQLTPENIEIQMPTRIYSTTIPNSIYETSNFPVIYVDHVRDQENSYLLISSDLMDGKGNLWREAMEMVDADLVFERLNDDFAVLVVPNPDSESIEFVGKHHFKVGEKAYYLNNEIVGVDAESFDVLATADTTVEDYASGDSMSWMQTFSHDTDNLYARGNPVAGADWETFDVIPGTSWYYWDKNWIYSSDGEKFENSDPDTFWLVDANLYGKDVNNVYLYGELVVGADPATFIYDGICGYDSDGYFMDTLEGYNKEYAEVSLEEWEALGCVK